MDGTEKGRVEWKKALFNLAVEHFCSYILIYLGHHTIYLYPLYVILPYK